MNESIIQLFDGLTDQVLAQIEKLSKAAVITNFEKKAFASFCIAAGTNAEAYLQLKTLPFNKIKKVKNLNTIVDTYIFLCVIELHVFLERLKNSKEIKDALDVPTEKFVKDFAECFGNEETQKYFNETLNFFDKVLADMRDPRDLWYNQAIWFGNKISEGQIDFGELTEGDLSSKVTISLVCGGLRIENAKLFDRIVFGEEYHAMSEIVESLRRTMGQNRWLKRALRKGRITQEFYDLEIKRIKGEQYNNPILDIKNGHFVIKLKCPRCGKEGENTFGDIHFRILGKDRKGYMYFECPDCKEHLQYDLMAGQIKIRKGILGFLFGKFS